MKKIIIKSLFLVLFVNSCISPQKSEKNDCDLSSSSREPNSLRCESIFKDSSESINIEEKRPTLVSKANIDKQLESGYDSPNIKTLEIWKRVLVESPQLKADTNLNKQIRKLIADESLVTYHIFLGDILNLVRTKKRQTPTLNDQQILEESALEVLSKILPKHMAEERSKLFLKEKMTYNDLLSALGKLTTKQSLEALVGKKGIKKIDPNSLIGQYIQKSKEMYGIEVKTLVDSFKQGPDYNGRGPEKLFIPVSQQNYSLIENILKDPHHLFHDYDLGQGTLHMTHVGKGISYARYDGNPGGYYQEGKLLPLINLSSIEASNATNYFTLGSAEYKFSKYPWGYHKVDEKSPEKMEGYCKSGGYSCCTHWIGEAPLGEKFVNEYSFPGIVDGYANARDGNTGVTGESNSELRTGPVGSYTHFKSNGGALQKIGQETRSDRLTRIVWTENQGRQQLWDMVGDKDADALRKAEWVNPGWVLYSFLTKTSQEKVPLVFVFKSDASQLDRNYLDGLTSRIRYY